MESNDALIRSWDDWMRARNLSEATRYAYRYGVHRFLSQLSPYKHVSQITRQDVVVFLIQQGTRGPAKAQYMKGLRSFFAWAAEQEDSGVTSEKDPTRTIRPKGPTSPPPDAYTLGEVISLIHAAEGQGQRRADALQAIYGLGIRRAEMCRLRPSDVDFERGRVTVHGKGDKTRFVPMTELAREALGRLCLHPANGTLIGITPSRLSGWGTEAAEAAGIKRTYRSLHILRRSYATHLRQRGIDVLVISRLLGHSNLAITDLYFACDESEKAEAVKVLSLT